MNNFNESFKIENICNKNEHIHYLSLKELREFIKLTEDLPDTLPIYYENISEELLLANTGWKVTPILWETNSDPNTGELEKSYSPGILAWQIYLSKDTLGTPAAFITAHY